MRGSEMSCQPPHSGARQAMRAGRGMAASGGEGQGVTPRRMLAVRRPAGTSSLAVLQPFRRAGLLGRAFVERAPALAVVLAFGRPPPPAGFRSTALAAADRTRDAAALA